MLEDQKNSVDWMRQEVGRLEAELQGVHAENAYLNRFEATPHPQRSPPSPFCLPPHPQRFPWLPPPSAAYAPARRRRLLRGRVEREERRAAEEAQRSRGAPGDSGQLDPPSALLGEEAQPRGAPAHRLGCWARRPDRRRFHRVLTVQCTLSHAKGLAVL